MRYKIGVQMFGTYEMTSALFDELDSVFRIRSVFSDSDLHGAEFLLETDEPLDSMKQKVKSFLIKHREIYYFDVVYLADNAVVPDRWVAHRNGMEIEFKGSVTFTEVSRK